MSADAKGRARERSRRYVERHPDRVRKANKLYRQQHPERLKEYESRDRERHPERHRARQALTNAARDGKIVKPDRCEGCESPTEPQKLHGHHHDYDKPLEVEWLCHDCHVEEHWG